MAAEKLRQYAETSYTEFTRLDAVDVLARLDAAEEVCKRLDADYPHRLNGYPALNAALDRWKELAEPKPEHELIYGSASAALYSCRCGWELPRDVAMSADRIANAFAKHVVEATNVAVEPF